MREQRGIQSIEVGGRLLLALVHEGRPMALKDLAQAAGMAPPKAHPYLVSFGKLGLISQDDTSGHYGLGPLAMQLGLISLQQSDPVRLATAQLPALAEAVGQTVGIAVWGPRGATIVAGGQGAGGYYFFVRDAASAFTYIPDQVGYFSDAQWRRLADEILARRPALVTLTDNQLREITKRRPEFTTVYVKERGAWTPVSAPSGPRRP